MFSPSKELAFQDSLGPDSGSFAEVSEDILGGPCRSVRAFPYPIEALSGNVYCLGLCFFALWLSSTRVSKVRLCVQVHLAHALHLNLLCHGSVEAFSILRFVSQGVGHHFANGVSSIVRCR